ncbi:MAG TPA: urate oxidase [Bryobacteraceae bacterium]|nr:urate oxidase [Bryobacteraceae bacterium]
MQPWLAQSNYGESCIRLVKVGRQTDHHDLKDLTIGIQFEGDFDSSYIEGDNRKILPTDTMKNTVYALAKLYPIEQIEDFGRTLVEHFLTDNSQLTRVRAEISQQLWNRIPFGGKLHATSFTPSGDERRTAVIAGTREGVSIQAGIDNLIVLKTTDAAFVGYIRDPFTTLKESRDRVLTTAVKAAWNYTDAELPFGPYWHGVREAILQTFIEHKSKSIQHTLYTMAEAVLERYEEISEIVVSLPSRHCELVDLSPLGLENKDEVFIPSSEPYDLVEARVRRDSFGA